MTDSIRQQRLASHNVNLSLIVPAYNEEAVIAEFLSALLQQTKALGLPYEIIVVDDASQDKTYDICAQLAADNSIKLLSFSRNFGKEVALSAGLDHCSGDIAILMDADFQHPIAVIPEFLQQWANGYDMVYGIRKDRDNESRLKRHLSNLFYRIMSKITNVEVPRNAGDFRLLDRCVIDSLKRIEERSRFMKGLYAWVGYKTIAVPFTVQNRAGGTSSWNLSNLTELAITGITSFSEIPLRFWGVVGFIISFISFCYAIYIIGETLFFGVQTPGFATLSVVILFLGGVQLLSIGILGEYIGRIFNEVKQRPLYLLAKKIGFDDRS